MGKETEKLVREIEAYCQSVGITTTAFGSRAMNDSGFVGRLRSGGSTSLENAGKVRDFIASASEGAAA